MRKYSNRIIFRVITGVLISLILGFIHSKTSAITATEFIAGKSFDNIYYTYYEEYINHGTWDQWYKYDKYYAVEIDGTAWEFNAPTEYKHIIPTNPALDQHELYPTMNVTELRQVDKEPDDLETWILLKGDSYEKTAISLVTAIISFSIVFYFYIFIWKLFYKS